VITSAKVAGRESTAKVIRSPLTPAKISLCVFHIGTISAAELFLIQASLSPEANAQRLPQRGRKLETGISGALFSAAPDRCFVRRDLRRHRRDRGSERFVDRRGGGKHH
jgi:hypothetical protein